MTRPARILLAAATALACLALHPAGAVTGCPSPATCRTYALTSQRWPSKDGRTEIHYRVNAMQPWVLSDQVLIAVDAAAKTWEAADPAVRFVFDGATNDLPQLGDGVNEISWVATLDPATIAVTNHRVRGSSMVETDTILNVYKPWAWQGCDGRIVSCADATGTGLHPLDVQAVITQQMGHWLSLASVESPFAVNLTMYGQASYGERRFSTLGLGDVLGVRAAYPCRRCPPIRIYTP